MQQVSTQPLNTQATAQTAELMPFSFGMSAEEGQNFYDILQQTVTDLEQGKLSNEEIADQLAFIKQNIPSELMTKLKTELELAPEEELTSEDELSATAFAVLNLIDNIIEDIEKVETKPQLQESMEQSGISDTNIATAFDILETPATKTSPIEASAIPAEKTTIVQTIAQFKAKELPSSQFLSEKIMAGEKITDITKPIATNNQQITQTVETEELIPETTSKPETIEATKANKNIAEILSLFKKTKQVASDIGINLNKAANKTENEVIANEAKSVDLKQTDIKTITPTETAKVAPTMQQEHAIKTESQKTHGEANKSEFKELASKFIAQLGEESRQTITPTETVKQEPTLPTQPVLNKAFTATTNIDTKMHMNSVEAFDIETIKQTAENTESSNTNKPLPSNFNMQLYKTAQQAGIQNQINLAIRNFKSGNQQLKIKLNPEELGSVTINMEMSDNVAKGIISVERPEVAQQLAQNLNKMFEGFKNSGVNLNINDIVIKVDEEPKNKQSQEQEFNEDNEQEQSSDVSINLTEEELDIKV